MSLLGWGLLLLGAALLAVAALGVLRLPGALAKQHAATKAATLALGVMVLGVAALYPDAAWWGRLALLIFLLLVTLPLASHALARAAAAQEQDRNGEPD
jgi:multicomponent Na+:H+ antiporter subunit G